ncbi:MAG: HWE histidine kinase domain-containing protein [Pseudomonadota bacterium]
MTYSAPSLWPTGTAPATEFYAEEQRLATLASYDASALAGDPELARIARFAAHLCGTPQAAVSLVEAERQTFIASEGLDTNETPRSTSLCAHAMLKGEILEVRDATADPRFADFAIVTGAAHLRFYAGAPLISAEGAPLGALCVLDSKTRLGGLSDVQREGLQVLADAVKRRLLTHREAGRATAEIKSSAQRLQFMLDSVPDIAWSAAPGPDFDFFNARFQKVTGKTPPKSVADWRGIIHPDEYDASAVKFQKAIASASMFEDEWRMRQADGGYRWVLSRAVPSSDDPETARWFGTLTDIDESYRIRQERELLAGELAHRIKNIFSVIIGLVSLHTRGDATLKVFGETLSDNIRALSRAQEFALQMDRIQAEDLKGLLTVLMAPYGAPGASAVTITGEKLHFGARAATPLALVFHELATNSAKYGALSVADGNVAIRVDQPGDNARITWTEANGPEARSPESEGFGSRLMMMAVTHQLQGTMEQDWAPEGLRAVITVPLAALEK